MARACCVHQKLGEKKKSVATPRRGELLNNCCYGGCAQQKKLDTITFTLADLSVVGPPDFEAFKLSTKDVTVPAAASTNSDCS